MRSTVKNINAISGLDAVAGSLVSARRPKRPFLIRKLEVYWMSLVVRHSNSSTWDPARVWPRFRPADVTCMAKRVPSAAWHGTPTVPGMDTHAHGTSQHPRGERERERPPSLKHTRTQTNKQTTLGDTSIWVIDSRSWLMLPSSHASKASTCKGLCLHIERQTHVYTYI